MKYLLRGKYDSNLVKSETRKRVVQTIITFSVNNCEKQSIVVYLEVNETCCIEARRHHEKLREDELRSWRSRQQERYELFQHGNCNTDIGTVFYA